MLAHTVPIIPSTKAGMGFFFPAFFCEINALMDEGPNTKEIIMPVRLIIVIMTYIAQLEVTATAIPA